MSELPAGWSEVTLADVTIPRKDKANPLEQIEMPFIGLEEVEPHTGRVIAVQSTRDLKSAVALFKRGDVLYGRLRPYLNKVVLTEIDGAASAEFIVFPPSEALEQAYLQRTLMSPDFVAFTGLRSTGDRPRVSFETISDYVLPMPPLPEQRRIVAKIGILTDRSRRAREQLDHIPRLVEKYKQAVLATAFRGDLTRDWRTSRGLADEKPISAEIDIPYRQTFTAPSSWSSFRFEEVCTIEGGGQPPKSTFEYAPGPHLIRFVQIRDYKSDDRVTFIPRALARRFCTADDIMIGRYGPPIFQILRGIQGAYNVALMKAVPDSNVIEKEYLYRYLNHPDLRAYVEFEAQRTAGQDGVNKRHLLAWPILLPPIDEQAEIVRRIDRMMAWIDHLASDATSARRLIDRLDQSLLAKAFRGELVPQDHADEPASVLLERIRAERSASPKARGGRKAGA